MTSHLQRTEAACRGQRQRLRSVLLGSAALGLMLPIAAAAQTVSSTALPSGGQVTSGSAAISQSGTNLTVTQSSNKAILNWQSFNIGSQAQVNFSQPSTASVALNRVTSGIPSQILGKLTANGQVFLLNAAGILFGQGSQVNVGGLVASTMTLADSDFLGGSYKFQRNGSTASVVNEGSITATPGGYIGLLAPNLLNEGTISAHLGTVVLAAGEVVTLTLAGSNVSVQVDPATVATLIQNNAMIAATDGHVILTAKAADSLLKGVINNAGTIEAGSLTSNGGTISLEASDTINLTGTIDASGATTSGSGKGGTVSVISTGTTTVAGTIRARGGIDGGNGGTIETSGHLLSVGAATIDASASKGKDGSWLLDPYNLTVDSTAASTINSTLNAGTSVSLQTSSTGTSGTGSSGAGNGDIVINAGITWNTGAGLTLSAYNNIDINAAVNHTGNTSAAVVFTPNNTGATSGNLVVGSSGSVGLAANDALTIGGQSYTLITTAAQLQAINTSGTTLAGNYAVANTVNLAGVTFTPIGSGTTLAGSQVINPFTGNFEGLGNTISNLTINQPTGSYIGLFGESVGTLNDVKLTTVSITGQSYVGGLAGFSFGTISNSSVGGTVTSTAPAAGLGTSQPTSGSAFLFPYSDVGGLVGSNGGTITGSSASGAVVGSSNTTAASSGIGGLVGDNLGSISNSYATNTVTGGNASTMIGGLVGNNTQGTISSSFATGAVATSDGTVSGSATSGSIGGLVGFNNQGAILSSYASGAVSAGTAGIFVGGLVGYNENGVVTSSYSTGHITGGVSTSTGGLIGQNTAGTVTSSYWNTTTSGTTTGIGTASTSTAGATGFATATAFTAATYSGFDFTGTWGNDGGAAYPYLLGITYPSTLITYSNTNPLVTWSVANATAAYGTTNPVGTVTLSGIAAADTSNVTATVTLYNGTTPVTNTSQLAPGTYLEKVTALTGSAAGNYTLSATGDVVGTLTIQPKPLTWSVTNVNTSSGTLATLGASSLNGVLSGDNGAVSPTVHLFNGTTLMTNLATLAPGIYWEEVTGLTGPAAGNYSLAATGDVIGLLIVQLKPAINGSTLLSDISALGVTGVATKTPINLVGGALRPSFVAISDDSLSLPGDAVTQ